MEITIGRVAQELGISPLTILLWETEGLIKAKRTAGGWRLFDEGSLIKMKKYSSGNEQEKENKNKSPSEAPIKDGTCGKGTIT